ncbi:MauE/DoxX family redox-associated membrane protein [Nonomuraea purpurea]|uniref:MauE/DoxX family redox-associated membrane protein n=1 Tax=Nonomuraea purpurea TaxID=1849276 RepID=A0ABV8GPW2_9ACTN
MGDFLRVFPPVLLVVVFAASSLAKVAGAFPGFEGSVRALRLVPARWARAVAAGVIGVEIVVAGLLVTPWYTGGLALAAGVLAVFAVVAMVTRRRGLAVPCTCFGPGTAGGPPLGTPHAVRNALLAGVAIAGLFGRPATDDWAGAGVAGVAALVCAALVLRFEDIVALFGRPPGARRAP